MRLFLVLREINIIMETVEKNLVALKQMSPEDGKELWGQFLLPDEMVFGVYKGIRDSLVITDRRLIIIDVQGLTGKKKEVMFVLFSKVVSFAVETAGTLDFSAEMKFWLSGIGGIKINFVPNTDIFGIGRFLSRKII